MALMCRLVILLSHATLYAVYREPNETTHLVMKLLTHSACINVVSVRNVLGYGRPNINREVNLRYPTCTVFNAPVGGTCLTFAKLFNTGKS